MIDEARNYVGTSPTSGEAQLELLKMEGCLPCHRVLEIGCGCLHAAVPLVWYLDAGNYVGVDPNEWLRKEALAEDRTRRSMEERKARFLSADDFDVRHLNEKFDFVFAHSVLSHCAHWQMPQFLRNANAVLRDSGRILASIRLSEGNKYGSSGHGGDSMDDKWQYPGVSWFKLETVCRAALQLGLATMLRPHYTDSLTKRCPNEYHDWLSFCRA